MNKKQIIGFMICVIILALFATFFIFADIFLRIFGVPGLWALISEQKLIFGFSVVAVVLIAIYFIRRKERR